MDIIVCLHQVPDPASEAIDPLTGHLEVNRLVYITSPPDLCALEAGLRLREEFGGQVSVFSVGPPETDRSLKDALAMGADRVLRIWEEDWENVSKPHLVAYALTYFIKRFSCDLILCGDGGDSAHASQVPAWIAEYGSLPLVTGIVELSIKTGVKKIIVKRKLEKGRRQVMECELPAVIAVTDSLNKPRECSLPNLIAALQSEVPVADLLLGTVARMIPAVVDGEIIYQTRGLFPEPQLIYTPDCSLTGAERIQALISGGVRGKRADVVQASPGEAAKRIIEFLETNEVITRR